MGARILGGKAKAGPVRRDGRVERRQADGLIVLNTGRTAVAAPTGLTATTISASEIAVAWTLPTAGSYATVERAQFGSPVWVVVHTAAVGAETWLNDGLAASTHYSYRAQAWKNGEASGYSNVASASTDAHPPGEIYGNWSTGNDVTGNGSIGNPYKTLTKCLQVAGDGDTIRLAGGLYASTTQVVIAQNNLTIEGYVGSAELSMHHSYGPGGWTLDAGTLYKRTCTEAAVRNAWYVGEPLIVVETAVACGSTAGSIFCDTVADLLYVNVGEDPPDPILVCHSDTPAISVTGSGVTLQYLALTYCNKALTVSGADCTLNDVGMTHQQGNQAKVGGNWLVPATNRWAAYVNANGFSMQDCNWTVTVSGAVRVESGTGSQMTGCLFLNDSGSMGTNYTVEYRAGTHAMTDCILRGGYQAAVHGIETADVTCTRCTVYDFGRIGFYANDGAVAGGTITCVRCVVYLTYNTATTESWGYVADTSTDNLINGNMTLYHCVAANLTRNTGAAAGLLMAGFGSNTYGVYVVRNCISKSNRYGYVRAGTPATWTETNNCANGNTSNFYGFTKHASSITSAPSFVNEGTDDYQLNTGSPCIDAGVYIAGVNDGYLGSNPDMGYWEYR